MKRRVTINIEETHLQEIDKLRGLVSRSAYLDHLLTVFLKYKSEEDARHELNKLLSK